MALAFVGGRVIVGDGSVKDSATVLVNENRITDVIQASNTVFEDYETIDATGMTIMPGIIDAHVHFCLNGAAAPLSAAAAISCAEMALIAGKQAQDTLKAGITTVRDLGGMHGVDLALRDAVAKGLVKGPRILASGQPICITGGHGWKMGREADGANEFRKASREQIKKGCDVVKVMSTGGVLTLGVEPGSAQASYEEQKAAVEEAHNAGKKVASHAQGTTGIINSLKAGVDSIEHGFYLNSKAIDLMLENNVYLIPTIAALTFIADKGVEAGIPEPYVIKAQTVRSAHKQSIQRAKEAGVPIAMGTDAGTPFNMHGDNANEIKLMVDYGFTALEAITASTLSAAKLLGLEGDLGTVEKGKIADLLMIKGDPLKDASILSKAENISLIVQDGLLVL